MPNKIWQELNQFGDAIYFEVLCDGCRVHKTGEIEGHQTRADDIAILNKLHWSVLEGKILCPYCTERRLREYALFDKDLEF